MRIDTYSIAIMLACAACGGTYEENGDQELATTESPGISRNGISRNGISRNGITRNGISRNGINGDANADVTSAGLDGRTFEVSDADATVKFLEYTVSCALAPAQSVDVTVNETTHHFTGDLALATEWEHEPCSTSCQRWVSSCILARTNAYGVSVQLSLRSSRIETSGLERLQYSQQEGAFFGNLFTDEVEMYACAGSMFDNLVLGSLLARLQTRVCADAPSSECPLVVTGPCNNFLLPPWALTIERSCTSYTNGYYGNCRPALGLPTFPAGTPNYTEVITTYLDPLRPVWWML